MSAPGFKILLVDDNEAFCIGLGELLSDYGHTVEVCFRGEKAIPLASRFVPDLIFLDVGLPDMDGCEVARRLKEMAGLSAVKIVSISGYCAELIQTGARDNVFCHTLVKPVKIEELEKLLDRLACERV